MLFISNVIIRITNQAIHNLRLSWWTLLHLRKVTVGGALLPARDCGVALSEAVDLLWMLSHNFLTQPIAKWITADSIIWHYFFLCRNYRREHVLPVSNVAWITKLYFRTKKDRKSKWANLRWSKHYRIVYSHVVKLCPFFCSNRIIRIKRCRSHNFANSLVHICNICARSKFGCGLLPASDCGVVLFGGGWLHSNHVSDNRNIPDDEVNNSRHDDLTLKFVMLEFCTGTCIISEYHQHLLYFSM